MPFADQFVTDEAQQAHANDMSGGAVGAGASPYPLYGLSQDVPDVVPFYKKPAFCWIGGMAAGVGIGWLVFGYLKPRMKPNTRRKKKEESE
jgi:hypothetical protein